MAGRFSIFFLAISIHAPREGGDFPSWLLFLYASEFQSTPPARGATENVVGAFSSNKDFNPRPPRGGRRNKLNNGDGAGLVISIHAPREGGDTLKKQFRQIVLISIHAPREGGDVLRTGWRIF